MASIKRTHILFSWKRSVGKTNGCSGTQGPYQTLRDPSAWVKLSTIYLNACLFVNASCTCRYNSPMAIGTLSTKAAIGMQPKRLDPSVSTNTTPTMTRIHSQELRVQWFQAYQQSRHHHDSHPATLSHLLERLRKRLVLNGLRLGLETSRGS